MADFLKSWLPEELAVKINKWLEDYRELEGRGAPRATTSYFPTPYITRDTTGVRNHPDPSGFTA